MKKLFITLSLLLSSCNQGGYSTYIDGLGEVYKSPILKDDGVKYNIVYIERKDNLYISVDSYIAISSDFGTTSNSGESFEAVYLRPNIKCTRYGCDTRSIYSIDIDKSFLDSEGASIPFKDYGNIVFTKSYLEKFRKLIN